jgi:flagellar FliL protein
MLPNRIEPFPTSRESAADVPAPVLPSPGAGGFMAWLPLIITVLLMPALAYAMTTLVLVPRLQKGLALSPAGAAAAGAQSRSSSSSSGRQQSVMMNKLLVNVAGTMGSRYLLVSLSLVGNDPDFNNKIQESEPQLRDMACGTLAAKTLADLEQPGARNLIRNELIRAFNNVLNGPVVQELYLTEFAIQ